MGYYRKLDAQSVPVGVVNQVVVAPFQTRGEDRVLIVIENLSLTETFEGTVWSSPNGTTQWVPETTDEFAAMAPAGTPRRLLLPPDRLWVRVMGYFSSAPDNLRVTVDLLRDPTWVAKR